MDILSYILGQKNALNKSETSDTTVTIYDGNVVFTTIPESQGLAYNSNFIPSIEPVTGKDITIIFNGQTYTLQDISETIGETVWAIFADGQPAIAVRQIADPEEWVIQILTSLMPSQDETQTLPVVIMQMQSSSGSSDFSTATITITENGNINGIISAPILFKTVTGNNEEVELTMGYIETTPHETYSHTIILSSSGISQIYIPPEKIDVISINGDIEDYTDGYYGITGDCAITVETNRFEQH